jgi:hypothetical protein
MLKSRAVEIGQSFEIGFWVVLPAMLQLFPSEVAEGTLTEIPLGSLVLLPGVPR